MDNFIERTLLISTLIFGLTACGGGGGGNEEIATQATNITPIANDTSTSVNEDSSIVINLSASDANGDSLSYIVMSQPNNGTLSGTAASPTYIPSSNYYGTDTFQFLVNDGTAESNLATVTITVNAVNDVPQATAGNVTVYYDNLPFIRQLQGSDIDEDTLTFEIIDQPLRGNVEVTNAQTGEYSYISDIAYGTDAFTFRVSDGLETTAVTSIQVQVLAGNFSEIEENNSQNIANEIYVSSVVKGNISTVTDEDWYSLNVAAGNYELEMVMAGSTSSNIILVELYDSAMTFLSSVEVNPESVALVSERLYFGVPATETYYIAIKQSGSGSSPPTEAYRFTVSETASGRLSEIEPNNSSNSATLVNINESMSGNISTVTDEDWYSLNVAAGNYELEMVMAGSTSSNIILVELYDSAMTFLSSVEVNPESVALVSERLYFGVPATETYYIAIKQSGSGSSPLTEAYRFTVSETASGRLSEIEPNNSSNSATLVNINESMSGNISTVTDEDWYSLNVAAGNYELEMVMAGSTSSNIILVELYDSAMTFLSSVEVNPESVALVSERLYFGVPATETYYIAIKQSGSGSSPPTEAYRFSITED